MTYGKDESRDLMEILEAVLDPRRARGVRYRFSHLLLMCIYAVLAGHSAAMEIAYYVELNFEYFKDEWSYVLWHLLRNNQNTEPAMRGVTPPMA